MSTISQLSYFVIMGQYFIVYNLTKKQSVKPAFANWKQTEIDWEDVIKEMGW